LTIHCQPTCPYLFRTPLRRFRLATSPPVVRTSQKRFRASIRSGAPPGLANQFAQTDFVYSKRLDHPNIVPVFPFGRPSRDFPHAPVPPQRQWRLPPRDVSRLDSSKPTSECREAHHQPGPTNTGFISHWLGLTVQDAIVRRWSPRQNRILHGLRSIPSKVQMHKFRPAVGAVHSPPTVENISFAYLREA